MLEPHLGTDHVVLATILGKKGNRKIFRAYLARAAGVRSSQNFLLHLNSIVTNEYMIRWPSVQHLSVK